MLALAGRATTRIELGTAVVPTYPCHPIAMAQEAMTANAATRGRLTLGLGLSHRPTIEDVMGLSYAHPAHHMQEYLTVLQALLHDHTVAYPGETLRVTADVSVTEPRPLPVLLAALAPRMLQLAGCLAEGTITWMAGVKTLAAHVVPLWSAETTVDGKMTATLGGPSDVLPAQSATPPGLHQALALLLDTVLGRHTRLSAPACPDR